MSNQLTLKDFEGKELDPNSTSLQALAFVAQVALQKLKGKQIVEADSSDEENVEGNLSAEENAEASSSAPKKVRPRKNKRESPAIKNNLKIKRNHLEIPNEEWLKQFTDKKKGDNSNAPPLLPEEFERKIIEKCGGLGPNRIIHIHRKKLFNTDITRQHGRLAMPLNKMETFEFLKDEEITLLRHAEAIRVPLIHKPMADNGVSLPLTEIMITFKQWDLHKNDNSSQKISYQYVLNSGWNNIVSEDKLRKNDRVDVWAFRDSENKLCMALVKHE